MQQQATSFESQGVQVRGFFHFPQEKKQAMPLVVMGNGFATEWQFGTQAIIKALTEAGIATLNFDYRGFGASDNLPKQPRQVIDTKAQLEDWRAAIAHAKSQNWLDQAKLALWGSSLGGGHCMSMAAEHPEIACAVAQVPHCCSREAFKVVSLSSVFKGMSLAIKDSLLALFGREPVLLPVVEEPERYGVMNYPGWKQHYYHIAANSKTWENAIPARSLLKAGDYRPVLLAEQIQCPLLLVAGKDDAGVPFSGVELVAAKAPKAELYAYEGDHFEVYHGAKLNTLVQQEVNFMARFLLAAKP